MKLYSAQTGAGENNTKLYFRKEVLKMKKLRKNGGFTLVEMLIVVAIIAILVAISIPLVTSSLDKAKAATDDANFRDAAAVGTIMYLDDTTKEGGTYWYIVTADSGNTQGSLTAAPSAPANAYKAQTATVGQTGSSGTKAVNANIKVVIDPSAAKAEDIVKVSWG